MVPGHICHIYGIWRSRDGGCFEVIIWGWQCKSQKWGGNFNLEVVGFSLYVILLCWNFVTGYWKISYTIPPFSIYLLFHLFFVYWDWQDQKCQLKYPKVYEINSELYFNCNFCLYPSLWYTNNFIHNLTRIHLLQLKIRNIWMKLV